MHPPHFSRAIVRIPSPEMVNGLSTAGLGLPDFDLALAQHAAYVRALESLGLAVTVLPPTPAFPDACFVEDVALCTPGCAVVTRPGAPTRRAETEGWGEILAAHGYKGRVHAIQGPGTLEAGDVMMVGNVYYVGRSGRTNAEGIDQLQAILASYGYTVKEVVLDEILHLKTGVSYLEQGRMLMLREYATAFADFAPILVDADEAYAANAIYVNGTVLLPAGFPKAEASIRAVGLPVILLEMSEFQKLDGGLSCLSLRF